MFRLTKSANIKIKNIASVLLVFVLLLGMVPQLGASASTAYANTSTIELEPVTINSELSEENLRTQDPVPLLVPISDQTFTPLNEGYAPDTQETKTITLKNAGPEMVEDIQVTVEDGLETTDPFDNTTNSTAFTVVQPAHLVLFDEGQETTFTVKADSNLTPGTYVGTVTVTAYRMTPVTFKVTQVVAGATPNYSIMELEDKVFPPLVKDYPAGAPDYREITISSQVLEELKNLQVSVSGGLEVPGQALRTQDSGSFEVTQPQPSVLTSFGKEAKFLVRAKDNLPVGTHIGTVTVTADTMTPVTFKVTQVVKAPEFYSITPISKQEMIPVAVGYVSGSQETRTITITKAGEGVLEDLNVWTSFGSPGFFEFTQPELTTLTDEQPTTTFTITAKNGLAIGHYAESIHIEAYRMKDTTFIASQLVKPVSNPFTYSIAPIQNPVFRDLEEGYAPDTQDKKTITLTNTGTGLLNNLRVDVSDDEEIPGFEYRGARMVSFEVSQPEINQLDVDASTSFTIKAKDGLEPGTYKGTVTINADNLTPVTFKVTQVVQAGEETPLTYSISSIGDQTLRVLEEGYASNTQETKAITVTNTGTGTLKELRVSVRDQSGIESRAKDNGSFEVTTPLQETLDIEASTTFTVKVRDGLPAGTYVGKVTVKADRMESVTFLVTQVVQAEEETPLTYSITPISDQTLNSLPSGYASGSQEARSITITRTGTADLLNVSTQLHDRMEARATVSDSVYFEVTQPVVQTLNSATPSTTFTVKAKDGLAPGTYTTTVRVSAAQMVPVYFQVTQVVNNPSIPDSPPVYYSSSPADPGVDVLVNGKKESAGKMVNTTADNRTVTTFTLDEQKLTQKLTAEGKQAVVTLPIPSQADVIIGELNGRMVKTMATQQAVLEIKTDTATYTLPAQQINIDALSAAIGQDVALADITIQVTIAKAQAHTVQLLEKAGQQGGYTPVVSLVSFTITASYKDKTVSVDKFNAYVARTIALPAGVDPNKITTGIVLDPDGTVRHVPTEVTLVNGIYYAKLNSLTNSDYAVVWHPLTFSDADGHWAQAAINDMGSRMVVSGNGQGLFNPNANITRAEFASIVVQGLGLKPVYEAGNFSDIAANAWYSGAVSTAHAYGLIAGYPDGSFRPNEQITREQAMTIIAKAMKLTGLKDKLTQQDLAAALGAYTDSSKVAGWAAAGVADCVQAEIIKGRSGASLAPKANLTRAEMAVIVRLLLQNSHLI